MGMVSRLVSHKGLDLVKAVLDELLETTDIQVVVLGSGDWEYENFFREAAARHPGKLASASVLCRIWRAKFMRGATYS